MTDSHTRSSKVANLMSLPDQTERYQVKMHQAHDAINVCKALLIKHNHEYATRKRWVKPSDMFSDAAAFLQPSEVPVFLPAINSPPRPSCGPAWRCCRDLVVEVSRGCSPRCDLWSGVAGPILMPACRLLPSSLASCAGLTAAPCMKCNARCLVCSAS